MKVKDLATIKANFSGSISEANRRYAAETAKTSGVIDAAKAGQAAYEHQMTDSAILKRRLSGLDKVTDADWQKGIKDKGVRRHDEGMRAGVDKQANGYAPIKAALEAVTLPARSTDWRTNLARITAVIEAEKKAAGKS